MFPENIAKSRWARFPYPSFLGIFIRFRVLPLHLTYTKGAHKNNAKKHNIKFEIIQFLGCKGKKKPKPDMLTLIQNTIETSMNSGKSAE